MMKTLGHPNLLPFHEKVGAQEQIWISAATTINVTIDDDFIHRELTRAMIALDGAHMACR